MPKKVYHKMNNHLPAKILSIKCKPHYLVLPAFWNTILETKNYNQKSNILLKQSCWFCQNMSSCCNKSTTFLHNTLPTQKLYQYHITSLSEKVTFYICTQTRRVSLPPHHQTDQHSGFFAYKARVCGNMKLSTCTALRTL